MEEKNKNLLLQDLCSRLPYGVKASYYGAEEECETWDKIEGITTDGYVDIGQYSLPIEGIKPYLFPLSSMTEEQWNNAPRVNLTNFTFESLKCGCFTLASYTCDNDLHDLIAFVNWLIKNHFDVNNLIPMGLAIDATNLNIY